MSNPRAIDCQSFAGALTLGMSQAGFDIAGKREDPAGFGWPLLEANLSRMNVSNDFEYQAANPSVWHAPSKRVDVVFGNPPCTAFSQITGVNNKTGSDLGANHALNSCMWNLIAFAGDCEAKAVVMESVQGAYKIGRELMLSLRYDMEERTGKFYDLTHVLHNNASIGGASIRKRYFFVLTRRGMRFGIEPPVIERVPVLDELLYDLENLKLTPEPQKYKRKPRGFGASYRTKSGYVDGHEIIRAPVNYRIEYVARNSDWEPGERIGDAAVRVIRDVGYDNLPELMFRRDGAGLANEVLSTSAFAPRRWNGSKAARVIMAYAGRDFVHPRQPRGLTMREVARVIGYPDEWTLEPVFRKRSVENQKWFGKGVSVPCGAWIGGWVHAALDRQPGPWRGEKIGDHEWLIDVTNDHKAVYDEKTGEQRDSRSRDLVRMMEAREWALRENSLGKPA